MINRDKYQLSNPFSRLNGVFTLALVHYCDKYFPFIIAVNQAYGVCQSYAVVRGQAAPGRIRPATCLCGSSMAMPVGIFARAPVVKSMVLQGRLANQGRQTLLWRILEYLCFYLYFPSIF